MLPPASDPPTPEDVLTLLATNMSRVAMQHVDFLRVMLTSLPTMNTATRAKFFEQVPLFALGTLEQYFQQQIEAGVFRADLEPAVLARIFPGTLFFFLMLSEILRLPDQRKVDEQALVSQVVSVFLDGALAEPRARASQTRGRRSRRKE
ncbi:MAG: TetR/AcrR family transcriptional regulator C-terminal domain-containing protein, partial [Chloroflexi bacterium]|nr:TetR/AcrR family transcriptional regulator C-terminal domain-containing protein [Chloroflexota bacterium]